MDWTEIVIEIHKKHADTAASVAQMAAGGIYIEDYGDIEENTFNIDLDMVKIHMYKYAKQMVTKICNINLKRAYKSIIF